MKASNPHIWRNIHVEDGVSLREAFRDGLRNSDFQLNDRSEIVALLVHAALDTWNHAPMREWSINLVRATVEDLNLDRETASIDDVLAAGVAKGFALCPPELGPLLRVQYLDQCIYEYVVVAMQPIDLGPKGRFVFALDRPSTVFVLDTANVEQPMPKAADLSFLFATR